jgi:DNA-binding NarL/FixJ family response regulator
MGHLALESSDLDAHDESMSSVSSNQARPSAVTACLVEDHANLREQLHELLLSVGVDVLAAVGTVRDGEAAIHRYAPDFAIVDNHLPDGRGIDLIRRLAETEPQMTLLLYTTALTEEQRKEALAAGASAVILKTIRGDALIEALRPDRARTTHAQQTLDQPTGNAASRGDGSRL